MLVEPLIPYNDADRAPDVSWDKIGTLEVGKGADIAVLDRDLYSVSNEQIKNLKCLMTCSMAK